MNMNSNTPTSTYIAPKNNKVTGEVEPITGIHIVCIVVMLMLTGYLIYLVKKHFIKFIGFYIVRKDYQRLQVADSYEQQPLSSSSPQITLNNNDNEYNKKSSKFQAFKYSFKQGMIRNTSLYHPLCSLVLWKQLRKQIKQLPLHITIGLLLLIVLSFITLSFTLTNIVQAYCFDKRYFGGKTYICLAGSKTNVPIPTSIGLSFLTAIIIVPLSMIVTYYLSKNYISFMRRIASNKHNNDQTDMEAQQSKSKKPKEMNHQHTLQNMLGADDSEYSKRSQLGYQIHEDGFQGSSKVIVTINEEDEELNISPTKNKLPRSVINRILGENQNLLNTRNIVKQSQTKSHNPPLKELQIHEYENESVIIDPPQFSSVSKKKIKFDENTGGRKTPLQMSSRPISSQRHHPTSVFSDSTAANELGHGFTHRPQSKHNLEGIKEEDNLQEDHGTLTKQRLKDAGFDHEYASKEEFKDNDASNDENIKDNIQQDQQQYQPLEQGITKMGICIILLATVLCLLGILFDLYSVINMSSQGIYNTLIIFAISIILDTLLFRFVAIIGLSLVQIKQGTIQQRTTFPIDEERQQLLESIYEVYETPLNAYITENDLASLNGYDQESYLQKSRDQSSSTQRLIKLKPQNIKSNRPNCELVLIESTYFYHQPQNMTLAPLQQNQDLEAEGNNLTKRSKLSDKKSNKKSKGQKLKFAKTMPYNAQEPEFKKSYTEKVKGNDDSNYDIEEIPYYSGRQIHNNDLNREEPSYLESEKDKSFFLPPINMHQHQFETPNVVDGRNKSRTQGAPVAISQQQITFNECKESMEFTNQNALKDLLHQQSSKKKMQDKNQYSSLKRYLDNEDKENQMTFNQNTQSVHKLRESTKSIKNSQNKIKKHPDQSQNEDQQAFIPQYNSNMKQKINPCQFLDLNDLNSNDLNNEHIYHQKSSRYQSKNKLSIDQKEADKLLGNKKHSKTAIKKVTRRSYNSPSSIKENLDQRFNQPNVSPFDDTKYEGVPEVDNTRASIEGFEGKQPTQGKSNLPSFQHLLKPQLALMKNNNKHLVQNLVLQEQSLPSNNSSMKDLANSIQQSQRTYRTKIGEDSIDKKVKKVLKKDADFNHGEYTINLKQTDLVNNNDFETEKSVQQYQHQPQSSTLLRMDSEEQELINEEDSNFNDDSTLQIIMNNKTNESLPYQKTIDFYAESQDNKQPKKGNVFDITEPGNQSRREIMIFVDNNQAGHSKKQSVHVLNQGETSPSSKDEQEDDDRDEFNIMAQSIQGFNQDELNEAAQEAQEVDMKFCRRISQTQDNRNSRVGSRNFKGKGNGSQSSDSRKDIRQSFSTNEDGQGAFFTDKVKKEKDDSYLIQLRVEEQRRKLKHFLKLARQLKSEKDEKKILEFLSILKTTKKPLPVAKINELKKLEIMSSPYNQSLISMIKDEIDRFGNKPPSAKSKARNAKSQQRQEQKTGVFIRQLTGIYGTTSGSGFSSIRKDLKSRESSQDPRLTGILPKPPKMNSNKLKDQRNSSDYTSSATRVGLKQQKRAKRNQVALDSSQQDQIILHNAVDGSSAHHIGLTTSSEGEYNDNGFFKNLENNAYGMVSEDEQEFNNLHDYFEQKTNK